MPSRDTFSAPEIGDFVKRYLSISRLSVDPFARNCALATVTNDLNPETKAQIHKDAREFLAGLEVRPDLVIFDPPYSPRQISEVYQRIGRECKTEDTQNAALYSECRNRIAEIMAPGGTVLSFGWNSSGMGKQRGFEIVEIMIVCHGGAHNDTICMAERQLQTRLL